MSKRSQGASRSLASPPFVVRCGTQSRTPKVHVHAAVLTPSLLLEHKDGSETSSVGEIEAIFLILFLRV